VKMTATAQGRSQVSETTVSRTRRKCILPATDLALLGSGLSLGGLSSHGRSPGVNLKPSLTQAGFSAKKRKQRHESVMSHDALLQRIEEVRRLA
jgi:hypothetical protein